MLFPPDPLILNPTRGIQACRRRQSILAREINTESNPSKDSITDILSQQRILDNWITSGSFLCEDRVIRIHRQFLSVGGVWRGEFNRRDQILVEEQLSDVGNISSAISTVGIGSSVEVSKNVDVRCTAEVVPWEESGELSNTQGVRGLQTTKESSVDVGGVGRVSITRGDNAGVDPSGVAVCLIVNFSFVR